MFLVFGCILYRHNVVGKNTYSIYTKMGVGKRPDATFWETYRAKKYLYTVGGLGDIFYMYIGGWVCDVDLDLWALFLYIFSYFVFFIFYFFYIFIYDCMLL